MTNIPYDTVQTGAGLKTLRHLRPIQSRAYVKQKFGNFPLALLYTAVYEL